MNQHRIDDLVTFGAIGALAAVVFVLLTLLATQGRLPVVQSSGSVMHYLFDHPRD